MIVVILLSHCEFLGDNLYKLPFSVNDCNILYEGLTDKRDYFWGYSIGHMYNQTYRPVYYLHTSNREEQVIFDSEKISRENKWL